MKFAMANVEICLRPAIMTLNCSSITKVDQSVESLMIQAIALFWIAMLWLMYLLIIGLAYFVCAKVEVTKQNFVTQLAVMPWLAKMLQ